MSLEQLRVLGLAAVLGISLGLAGCGSDSDNRTTAQQQQEEQNEEPEEEQQVPEENGDDNPNTVEEGVEGPLDEVQTPLHTQVFSQLQGAVTGTPLEGTIDCGGQAVVLDVIDILDAIALALMTGAETQDPAAAFDSAAGDIEFAVGEFAHDLEGALTALAGQGDCNRGEGGDGEDGDGEPTDNPLAGTPLEPLGDALAPVLAQIPTDGDDNGGDMDLQSLSALVHELAVAFNGGLAMIPAEAAEAPIVGGLLTTLSVALTDLDLTLMNLGVYDGAGTASALETTLNHLLVNVLTEIVPINFIETQAGQEGVLSGPITDGVNQATAALGDNLLNAVLPPLTDALDGPLAVLLDPIENQVLPAILGPITDAIAGGGGGGDGGPTGTPLDMLLGPITDALGGAGGGGGDGPTGTPLDLILGPLLDAAGGTGGGCPLAGTPLEPGCALFDAAPL